MSALLPEVFKLPLYTTLAMVSLGGAVNAKGDDSTPVIPVLRVGNGSEDSSLSIKGLEGWPQYSNRTPMISTDTELTGTRKFIRMSPVGSLLARIPPTGG